MIISHNSGVYASRYSFYVIMTQYVQTVMGVYEVFENPLEYSCKTLRWLFSSIIAQEISICVSRFGKAHHLEIMCGLKITTLIIMITMIMI